MKYIIGLVAMLLPILSGAQATPVKPLGIGDPLPPELWAMPVPGITDQQKEASITLSDYRGKVIILDFWATWCSPCVKGLPKLSAFQQSYKNDIKIIPVSHEQKAVVKNFFQKLPALQLPSVFNDTMLVKYFPHRLLPHCVIIGKDGKLAAITTSEDLTSGQLSDLVQNRAATFTAKIDKVSFSWEKPLLFNNNGGDENDILYHSVLTRFVDGINGITMPTKINDSIVGFKLTDQPVTVLYLHAFNKPEYYYKSRVYFEGIADTEKFIKDLPTRADSLKWDRENTFCYELIAPGLSDGERRQIMIKELDNAFKGLLGITCSMGQRQTNCLVLRLAGKTNRLRSDGRYAEGSITSNRVEKVSQYRNIQLKHLLPGLEDMAHMPVIDETGFTGHFDMDIPMEVKAAYAKTKDISLLQKLLARYGLKIEPAVCETEMLVISPANSLYSNSKK